MNLSKWKDSLTGEPAFLIGNGPSATDEPIDQLTNYFSIGINRAFMLIDPTVLLWQDSDLLKRDKKAVLATQALKVCKADVDPDNQFYHYTLDYEGPFRLSGRPDYLCGRWASGPLAFQFAYALGCNPIVLVGFDCAYRDGKTDFYGINPNHKDRTLPYCLRGLRWIKDSDSGRQVINCSANTVYPSRVSLAEVVRQVASSVPKEGGGSGKGRDYYKGKLLASAKP